MGQEISLGIIKMELTNSEILTILEWGRSAKSMLVFGVGNDSRIWANHFDDVIFIEDDHDWITRISGSIPANVVEVKWPTIAVNYKEDILRYLDLGDVSHMIPNILVDLITTRSWDYCLVDGPKGWLPKHDNDNVPGRVGSILAAAMLQQFWGTEVVVHDVNRIVERSSLRCFFGEPEITSGKLALYKCDSKGLPNNLPKFM